MRHGIAIKDIVKPPRRTVPKRCSRPRRICIVCRRAVIHKNDRQYELKICKACWDGSRGAVQESFEKPQVDPKDVARCLFFKQVRIDRRRRRDERLLERIRTAKNVHDVLGTHGLTLSELEARFKHSPRVLDAILRRLKRDRVNLKMLGLDWIFQVIAGPRKVSSRDSQKRGSQEEPGALWSRGLSIDPAESEGWPPLLFDPFTLFEEENVAENPSRGGNEVFKDPMLECVLADAAKLHVHPRDKAFVRNCQRLYDRGECISARQREYLVSMLNADRSMRLYLERKAKDEQMARIRAAQAREKEWAEEKRTHELETVEAFSTCSAMPDAVKAQLETIFGSFRKMD